ncbi:hypothetical protein BDZ89DRAFT_1147167 [Hymenopellis radicata]|nr:hypothetical protein BDZ89DRAFT_1147167 [Hymenopellis radicata]
MGMVWNLHFDAYLLLTAHIFSFIVFGALQAAASRVIIKVKAMGTNILTAFITSHGPGQVMVSRRWWTSVCRLA